MGDMIAPLRRQGQPVPGLDGVRLPAAAKAVEDAQIQLPKQIPLARRLAEPFACLIFVSGDALAPHVHAGQIHLGNGVSPLRRRGQVAKFFLDISPRRALAGSGCACNRPRVCGRRSVLMAAASQQSRNDGNNR